MVSFAANEYPYNTAYRGSYQFKKHFYEKIGDLDSDGEDFVCALNDGRFLVVEYKGADRWSNDDSQEKRIIGQLWASRSNGQCLFIMPKGKDLPAIKAKLAKS